MSAVDQKQTLQTSESVFMNLYKTLGMGVRLTWCFLFAALLMFAWVQRDLHDMPVAATLFAMGLSLPAGPIIIALIGWAKRELSTKYSLPYEPFSDFFVLWCTGVGIVYIQWFWILPKIIAFVLSRLKQRALR